MVFFRDFDHLFNGRLGLPGNSFNIKKYIYIYPIASMYGIFTYIYHILPLKTTIHVGKYTSPMDGMGVYIYISMYQTLVLFQLLY